jgi:hypothetical protein
MSEPVLVGDPFAVACNPFSSEIEILYEDMHFAPITSAYARTFAAALISAADKADRKACGAE